jgi:cyclic beta-1,2-glucan synthetase
VPWINVLANPGFGCHVTEMGAGHTWALNSRQHAITRWANDPVADTASEWLLLQDEASGRCWPLGRWLAADSPREVEHAPGCTRMRQCLGDVEVTLTWCVDRVAPLRQTQVALRSLARGGAPALRLRLVAVVPWQLGENGAARVSVACGELALAGSGLPHTVAAVQATQRDPGNASGTAWVAIGTDAASASAEWSCDRREFHDGQGRLVLPARLARTGGSGLDPCGAVGLRLVLPAGGAIEATLWLGHAASAAAAAHEAPVALGVNPHTRLREQRQAWQGFTMPVRVASPDARFDALFNHWLPYQATACRLWARAGYYQAGGAFGFRDQLQDAMAMAWLDPTLLEQQLLRVAARQFREGDVQHWWHEPGGAGVRTRFSDDRLWLPLALALHQRVTARSALLDEPVPFLEGRAVPAEAEDVYETPGVSSDTATLYEHAARAIDASLTHGAHGLPLIGTGDWNDGMNRVGHEGRGESVWLAWFTIAVIDALAPIATARGDHARVQAWLDARQRWQQALEAAGWDGRWYRRAFFDDGSALGSSANAEARIDLIAQAWAVLAGSGDTSRAETAMDSAAALLWEPDAGVLRLLHPPLAQQRPAAGYIQAYPPGVRENGGQYNHGAVWAVMAAARLHHRCLEQGRQADATRWQERAWAWFRAISPAHRHEFSRYGGEPWAVAGDVHGVGADAGRCGWSWYTGAAGWAWRAALQALLGVHAEAQGLRVLPCLPPGWPFVEVTLQRADGPRRLRIVADAQALAESLALPGCSGQIEGGVLLPWASVPVSRGDAFCCVAAVGVQSPAWRRSVSRHTA